MLASKNAQKKPSKQLDVEHIRGKKKYRVAKEQEHEAKEEIKDYIEHESDYLRVEDD
jgi:hypothetical protein